jgi:hypothetical protein
MPNGPTGRRIAALEGIVVTHAIRGTLAKFLRGTLEERLPATVTNVAAVERETGVTQQLF